MAKKNNGVQGLIGLERFTRFGVKSDKAEIAFFSVEPTNISVLSAANIDVKIHHLMMLLSTIPDVEILAQQGLRQKAVADRAERGGQKTAASGL